MEANSWDHPIKGNGTPKMNRIHFKVRLNNCICRLKNRWHIFSNELIIAKSLKTLKWYFGKSLKAKLEVLHLPLQIFCILFLKILSINYPGNVYTKTFLQNWLYKTFGRLYFYIFQQGNGNSSMAITKHVGGV